MEATGLAIGAVALIGVFKDAIDLFALFKARRDVGQDLGILLTKLDLEKFVLLQWAEEVRFLHFHNDTFEDDRLNQSDVQNVVFRILSWIRVLMSNASQLKGRYGVSEPSDDSSESLWTSDNQPAPMSGPCMERFERHFKKLRIGVSSRQDALNPIQKARWVIEDKAKFFELVSELAYFTRKLHDVLPQRSDSYPGSVETISMESLEHIQSIPKLQTVLEAAASQHQLMVEPIQNLIYRRCQERVLKLLWFRRMNDRRDGVDPAHQETFKWALKSPDELHEEQKSVKWHNLHQWFLSGSGIYWVCGKAGSGKSTLMKYLSSSDEAMKLLADWAGSEGCFMDEFFFYYLGGPEQKTQEGLSKALLHKILSRHPRLIAESLPKLWIEVSDGKDKPLSPSREEMNHAIEVISRCQELPSICLFIDGLDEYNGDFRSGVRLIETLAANPRVKVVVSSRPEPNCHEAFSELPSMRLQDLTRSDIKAYVQDKIGTHPYTQKFQTGNSDEFQTIIESIVDKASGVFLWVILACRSLMDGFRDYDRFINLVQRVNDLPNELKEMFIRMLKKVNPRHADHTAKLLRYALHAIDRYPINSVFHDYRMTALEVAFVSNYFDNEEVPIRFLHEQEREQMCRGLDGRLRSHSGGLLELLHKNRQDGMNVFCFCHPVNQDPDHVSHSPYCVAEVIFMHRTVFDFLKTDEAWNLNCLSGATCPFDPNEMLPLGRLFLGMQSRRLRDEIETIQFGMYLADSLDLASELKLEGVRRGRDALYKLAGVLDGMTLDADTSKWDYGKPAMMRQMLDAHSCQRHDTFSLATLVLSIESGALDFAKKHPTFRQVVTAKTQLYSGQFPLIYHGSFRPWLDDRPWSDEHGEDLDGMFTDTYWSEGRHHSKSETVYLLLSEGEDPNAPMPTRHPGDDKWTTWTWWLSLHDYRDSIATLELMDVDSHLDVLKIFEAFILAGADLRSIETMMGIFQKCMRKIAGQLGGESLDAYNEAMVLYSKHKAVQERDLVRQCWV